MGCQPRNAKQFDAAAEFARETDILRRDMRDAFDRDVREIGSGFKGKARKQRELMRRVAAADIEFGIGFRKTETLRFGEHVLERTARRFHLRAEKCSCRCC